MNWRHIQPINNVLADYFREEKYASNYFLVSCTTDDSKISIGSLLALSPFIKMDISSEDVYFAICKNTPYSVSPKQFEDILLTPRFRVNPKILVLHFDWLNKEQIQSDEFKKDLSGFLTFLCGPTEFTTKFRADGSVTVAFADRNDAMCLWRALGLVLFQQQRIRAHVLTESKPVQRQDPSQYRDGDQRLGQANNHPRSGPSSPKRKKSQQSRIANQSNGNRDKKFVK